MFPASLRSSSGEQTIQKTACGECLQHGKEREVQCRNNLVSRDRIR